MALGNESEPDRVNGGTGHAFLFIMLIKSLKFSRNNLPIDEKNFLAPDTVT